MSSILDLLPVALLTLVPWIELRGGIPLGIALGLDPLQVLVLAIVFNILLFFPIWIFLKLVYSRVKDWKITQRITQRALRSQDTINKWGIPGLAIFVAIPLPFTGVYTATLLAFLLQLSWKRAFLAIALGVVGAGLIVWFLSMGVATGIGAVVNGTA